jgi:hypothetical protein
MDWRTLFAFLFVMLSACTVSITNSGKNIRAITEQQASACDPFGPVTGAHSSAWTMGGDLESATNEAMNKAAELGADSIVIRESRSDFWGGASVAGLAFRCR